MIVVMGNENYNSREGAAERLSRYGRNLNAAVGTIALGGAAILPGPNVLLATYGYFNYVQAGGFELLRKHAKKSRSKKSKKS